MAITNKVLEFTLELTPGGIPPIIHASQGDVGRTFKANVVWNGSAASAYISGTTVNLRGKKPDKTVFDYSATLSGSAVTFATTEQMTIISGPVECELVFTSGNDVVASANFVLMVEDSPYNPDAPSESVIPGIVDLIEDTIGGDVRDEVAALIAENPELMLQDNAVTTPKIADGAITKAKLNENLKVIQYNILDYEGTTLNKKWDAMRQSFNPWEYKQILIPYPREGNPACIKVGNDWKWKIDGPITFTDNENCSTLEIYGELYAVAPVENVLLFDDNRKPENVHFANGVLIRGNRAAGNTIGCAIEIRAGARIDFDGEVGINDCEIGVIVGGDNQSAPAYANFEYLGVGFFDNAGVHIKGANYPAGLYADKMDLQIAQTADKDAVVIEGSVTPVNINYLVYGTDIAKDGYASYDARSALAIHGTTTADTHNINVGFVYATHADYGLYIDGLQTTNIYDITIGYVGVGTANKTAVYARYAQFLTIERIKNNNSFDVQHCLYSNIFKGIAGSADVLDRLVGISGTVNIDTESAVNDVPSIADKNLGAITIVKTANGTHAYINTGAENLIIDGQMFVPAVSALPTPSWQLRGKMYRVNSSGGQDIIAVCVRDTNAFRWFNIITQSFV